MSRPIYYHVDVNAAFLSWEAARRLHDRQDTLDLRTVPAVVGGSEKTRHGIVLAKSTPAKAFGIKTGEALVSAREKCPGLIIVPPDYPLYVSCSRRLMRYLRRFSAAIDQYSIDESFMTMTGCEHTLGQPVLFADELRQMIADRFGFTVNIGVSSNRLLAKMAGELRKPNRTLSLFPEEIPEKLWPLPVGDLFFVGRATTHRLLKLGITTVGELAASDPDMLAAHLKSAGRLIHELANGRDTDLFLTNIDENKGYGNAVTVPADLTDSDTADAYLLSLAETVGARLRADGMKARCVAVFVCTWEFERFSHQRMMISPTDVTYELYRTAVSLLREVWHGDPIRQIGIRTSCLTHEEAYQFSLFDPIRHDKLMKVDRAVDDIRRRMGENAVMRACFLKAPVKNMAGGLDASRRTGITKAIPDMFPDEVDDV